MISICSYKREHLDPSDLHIMEKKMIRTDGRRLSAVALKTWIPLWKKCSWQFILLHGGGDWTEAGNSRSKSGYFAVYALLVILLTVELGL